MFQKRNILQEYEIGESMITFTPAEIERAIKRAYEHNQFNETMFWINLKEEGGEP